MATLAFAAAGAAIGSAVLPTGISFLGAAISGATIGAQAGALAGSYVDQALFGSSGEHQVVQGPRLSDLRLLGSSEGSPIPRLYGTTRVGGQVIWADRIEEKVTRRTASSGGGKGGASGSGGSTTSVEYSYYASFAVALCEGEINGIRRAWADGQQINLSKIKYRLYTGAEDQSSDSLITSRLGADRTPAFRGTAYIVIERLALANYGNRIPQLSFEVQRSVDRLSDAIRSIVLIPGSGEFAYSPTPVSQAFGQGYFESENVHTLQARTDWTAALDQLEQVFPNNQNISLVVSWFGTDLRCDQCQILPGVERTNKVTQPLSWAVAGASRGDAYVVSERDGRPAYGGTPSDQTVVAAIEDLKDRGFSVTFNPFILMDVAAANVLPDPYSTAVSQPQYPWRGRITVNPAPGRPGTPDKTAAASADVAAIVGAASVNDFSISGKTVVYSGPAEWSLRRMVLHYAYLAKAAGGVDTFLLGSELRGLTWVRDGAGGYPFVAALVQLASDVRSILGPSTKISYGADWSEFFGHQPADGSGDVYFHLDPLWASSDIDAVGIDLYWPLSDWRDGVAHADYQAGSRSIYDLDYLHANVAAGEGYDWYYASDSDRQSQTRTPISDGAAGKPWVYRYKDLKSWWSNQHFDRPGGIEANQPTDWVPQSKPIWFTETGCPAIDKGANQPNVFTDPKSSESASPYFSNGARDDLMQRRYVDAIIGAFDPSNDRYVPDANPVSSQYGGRMVDVDRIYIYVWDSRPYPAFPHNTDVWGDGENWHVGHWLTGRLANQPLSDLVAQILLDYGFVNFDADQLSGTVAGYQIDRLMAPRDALQPLSLAYFFDARESHGQIVFAQRGLHSSVGQFSSSDLVETKPNAPLLTLTRAQETELPASAKVRYLSNRKGYQQAVSEARRLTGASGRVAQADLPIVFEPDLATMIAERWLNESWTSREHAAFTLPPSRVDVEPGDAV
jgi:GTA TIM-barrel-like domain/Putative phage tail protein